MKVDYSYVEIFLNAIDKKASLDDLRINEAYKTIQFHADKTGNSFGVEDIERALNGISDQAYGLRNLTRNIHRIRSLYQALVNQEETWLKEVESSLESLFDLTEYKKTTIYPVIGYDIGIGLNKTVCVNLNSEICLNDIRELISIIIHETSHTYYEEIHGSAFKNHEIENTQDMKELLYDVIHYEGVGVFSAEDYRIKHQLPNHGSMIQEDYLVVSDEKIDKALRNDFRRLMNDLDKGSIQSSDEFLQRTFNKTKLPHRLGYRIFNEIHQKSGIQGVKKAIKMSDRDFANKYLKRI